MINKRCNMEVKTLVCPNCGANTTNTENCEYCNSLLVRFVDKGIDISNTSYLSEECAFPAIVTNLKQNLELQVKYPHEFVVTDIYWGCKRRQYKLMCVLQSGKCNWSDGTPIRLGSNDGGLIVVIGFDDNHEKNLIAKFKSLPSFPLFACHLSKSLGDSYTEYAIDFGKDTDGAAKLISEILLQVYGLKPEDEYFVFTNVGGEVEKSRKAFNDKHGIPGWFIVLALIVCILLFIWDNFIL